MAEIVKPRLIARTICAANAATGAKAPKRTLDQAELYSASCLGHKEEILIPLRVTALPPFSRVLLHGTIQIRSQWNKSALVELRFANHDQRVLQIYIRELQRDRFADA